MNDETKLDTGGGASVGGDANPGRDLTGRDRVNPQQNMRSGDVHVGASGDFPVWKLMEMATDIRALVSHNLPTRVERLERLEVVVRPGPPPEVIVRPLAHDTVNLSVRMILVILVVTLSVVMASVGWLIFLQVARV